MEVRTLLRRQFRFVHQFLDIAIADVPPEIAARWLDGATINTIAQVYAHAVVAEDAFVARAQGGPAVLSQDGWGPRLGIKEATLTQTNDWPDLDLDLAVVREYAHAVYAATDDFLAAAPEEKLLEEAEGPVGRVLVVGDIMLSHVAEHWGEIVALKGVQGLKGLPF